MLDDPSKIVDVVVPSLFVPLEVGTAAWVERATVTAPSSVVLNVSPCLVETMENTGESIVDILRTGFSELIQLESNASSSFNVSSKVLRKPTRPCGKFSVPSFISAKSSTTESMEETVVAEGAWDSDLLFLLATLRSSCL